MNDPPVTVLLVDDEPPLLKMMSTYLRRLGFGVLTFGATDAAWENLGDDATALEAAVLDLSMKGMSSIELARRLLAANPKMHVIVASGYPASLDELESASPGRVKFLHKPFTPEALAACVRRAPK